MACSIFTTLAVTATLLGTQGLKLESQEESKQAGLCREDQIEAKDASLPNALVVLKNRDGEEVFATKIRVATALFYDYGHSASDGHRHERGGAVPEKSATFLYKFPRTARTLEAVSIELKTFDGTFAQTAKLKPSSMSQDAQPKLTIR